MRQKCRVCHWLSQYDCLQKPELNVQDAAYIAQHACCSGSVGACRLTRRRPRQEHAATMSLSLRVPLRLPEMINKVSGTRGQLALLVRWVILKLLSHHVFSAHTQLPEPRHSVGPDARVKMIKRAHQAANRGIANAVNSSRGLCWCSEMLMYRSSSSSR